MNAMKAIVRFFTVAALLLAASTAQAQMTADELLEHIDLVRAPGGNFIFSVNARTIGKEQSPEYILEAKVREKTKSLVLYKEPVKERGRVMLMDGQDMWIFIPGTSRSIRISPAQQVVGGVTQADIARVVFSVDYRAEKVEIVNENGQDLYKLSLVAKASNNPYRTLALYCNAKYEPVKCEFFSLSGRMLRTAHYENYQHVLGKMRPMTVRMMSAVDSREDAVMNYTDMQIKESPKHYFQPTYLNQIR